MWKIVSVCSIAMTCMLSSSIVCASQDSAAFIESLRDQSDMLRRQATVPEFLQQPAPGKHNDAWIQSLTRKSQQASARSKKTPRALYFLSFSIPEDGLIRMLPEARALGIPALVNGLIDNDFRKTAEAVFRITREKNTGGVQIDPMQFAKYGITSVPALVVTCGERYDLIRGNIRLKAALERVAKEGECAPVAEAILRESER